MTPKEKAKDLVTKLHKEIGSVYSGYWEVAKAQAIICVDEMLDFQSDFYEFEYLQEVKKEINLL